jgi:hypothetical protein
MEKKVFLCRCLWRFSLARGLLPFLLIAAFSLIVFPHAWAASQVFSARNNYATSPTQGPVGTVITVTGTNLTYPDGTQIDVGYTTNFSSCILTAESQGGSVSRRSFSGWLRWPDTTGTGNFGVCVRVDGSNSFQVSDFRVLASTPPQVMVTPTIPDAGKQATVTGANFLPGGVTVNLVWEAANGGQTVSLGSVTSDDTGAFTQTFTVPSNSSTGSYSVIATSGSSQPPTLSASTSFQVNGITITPVSTPGTATSSTATASASASSPTATAISKSIINSTGTGSNSSGGANNQWTLLMPIILGGLLLIVVTLVAGVLVVHKQRSLALTATSNVGVATSLPGSEQMFEPGAVVYNPPTPPPPQIDRSYRPVPTRPEQAVSAIPFDADLAEAMRQAQVSMYFNSFNPRRAGVED